jgi:endonuclease I
MFPKLLITIFTFLLFNFSFSQTVVINEIDADNSGFDTMEFVELKSFDGTGAALPNYSLNGYVLVFFNETNTASYMALDLDGYSTDINGIIHIGNSGVSPSPAFTFVNSSIQNGPDVVAIYSGNDTDFPLNTSASTSNLINAVAYATNATQPANLMSILGIPTSQFTNETTTHPRSSQRKNDGTWESKVPTPGVNNDGSGIVINYISVSTTQTEYIEGDSFNFVFTTSLPVTGSNLNLNFTLNNGNFNMTDFSGGLTVSIPVGQTTGQTGIILTNDGLDEGDEEMKFVFQSIPSGYVANNDNIIIRVNDINFATDPWGTPLNPTYGLCAPQIPVGYYDSLEGLSGATLIQAIQDIIANISVVRLHSYADIWEILNSSDRNPENNNKVWAIYREESMAKLDQQNSSSIVGKWNREHIFAQSRGGFETALGDTDDGINIWNYIGGASVNVEGVSDAHHIRVANGQENSSRGNKNFGDVGTTTVYAGPSGTQGSWKGDVARACFYMAIRFNALNVVNGSPDEYLVDGVTYSGNIGDLAAFLAWNVSDKADDFEMNRNNYIYTWQQNRNPFIDYPLLADYVFGSNFGNTWSSTLSNESFTDTSIKVYPNPTVDYIIVSGVSSAAKVEIYTITGQKVQETMFENEVRIPLNLQSGMYLVKISNDSSSITKKIIVK